MDAIRYALAPCDLGRLLVAATDRGLCHVAFGDRDAELEDKGFYETIAAMKVDQFGGLAHAWVIFEPRVGEARPERQIRGLDSIELSYDGSRWWVAAITTDFEGPDQKIPGDLIP